MANCLSFSCCDSCAVPGAVYTSSSHPPPCWLNPSLSMPFCKMHSWQVQFVSGGFEFTQGKNHGWMIATQALSH
eukprot:11201524-Lingulodinium_polyedra.AAC.1